MSRRVQGEATTPETRVRARGTSFVHVLTSANEEAIILRYVSNGRAGCTVTTRLSPGCWLAANDPAFFLLSFAIVPYIYARRNVSRDTRRILEVHTSDLFINRLNPASLIPQMRANIHIEISRESLLRF